MDMDSLPSVPHGTDLLSVRLVDIEVGTMHHLIQSLRLVDNEVGTMHHLIQSLHCASNHSPRAPFRPRWCTTKICMQKPDTTSADCRLKSLLAGAYNHPCFLRVEVGLWTLMWGDMKVLAETKAHAG